MIISYSDALEISQWNRNVNLLNFYYNLYRNLGKIHISMNTATKSYLHSYGHRNKELLQNNAYIHLFYQVTRVINIFTSVRYEDINTSTAITEFILKLNIRQ